MLVEQRQRLKLKRGHLVLTGGGDVNKISTAELQIEEPPINKEDTQRAPAQVEVDDHNAHMAQIKVGIIPRDPNKTEPKKSHRWLKYGSFAAAMFALIAGCNAATRNNKEPESTTPSKSISLPDEIKQIPSMTPTAYATLVDTPSSLFNRSEGVVNVTPSKTAESLFNKKGEYIVQAGDSLFRIVRKLYGLDGEALLKTVLEIAYDNSIQKPYRIFPKQELKVPATPTLQR